MSATVLLSPRRWRLILIDDSGDDRAEMRRLLLLGAERRYQFAEAATGALGVAAVRASAAMPDCVLLDYHLPDMDALDVLAGLAGPDGLPVCPVVVLTGATAMAAGRRVLRAGAQDFLAKDGLTPLTLTRAVENAIERLAMARELLARNAALQHTEAILSEADRRKDEFIATLAHELRNPLAPISSGLRVLRLSDDPALRRSALAIMERQLAQMTRLIDDLLDISRVTSGKLLLRLRPVAVGTVLEQAAEAALPLILAAQHRLRVVPPAQALWLDADCARLVQAVGNLLNNAAKYSQVGNAIELSAFADGGDVVIRVVDQGLGIPGHMLEQVFDMFTQVHHPLARAQGGLGIGLALVKQLVAMHGGSVIAESGGPGCGSTFSIRLPLVPAPAPAPRAVAPAAFAASSVGRRILVVDDNVDGAMMLATMLGLYGHAARTAFTGPEAIATGLAFAPEIVFLDIGLPGMNGYQVARHFRATTALKDVMLVALTGWGGDDDRQRAREAGFDLHLTKPVEIDAVEAVLSAFAPRGAAAPVA